MSGVKRLLEDLQDKTIEELETPVKIEDYNEFPDARAPSVLPTG